MMNTGYRMLYILNEKGVVAFCGFRLLTTTFSNGKMLYVDDLFTDSRYRRKGLATKLMNKIKLKAQKEYAMQKHLDSGFSGEIAHKFYGHFGFKKIAFHIKFILLKESDKP